MSAALLRRAIAAPARVALATTTGAPIVQDVVVLATRNLAIFGVSLTADFLGRPIGTITLGRRAPSRQLRDHEGRQRQRQQELDAERRAGPQEVRAAARNRDEDRLAERPTEEGGEVAVTKAITGRVRRRLAPCAR